MAMRRSDLLCPIFGSGCEIQSNVLPTYSDIMKGFLWISRLEGNKKYKDLVSNTCENIALKVEHIWHKASIPIVAHQNIVARIKAYHEKYRGLLKPYKGRQNVDSYRQKITRFKEESDKLFDIATCKCKDFKTCHCENTRKIPLQEREFITDQRNNRKMVIGGIDRETTQKNIKKIARSRIQKEYEQKILSEAEPSCSSSRPNKISQTQSCSSSVVEEKQYTDHPQAMEFPAVARTLDRYGISDRAGAAIVSAALQDVGLIS